MSDASDVTAPRASGLDGCSSRTSVSVYSATVGHATTSARLRLQDPAENYPRPEPIAVTCNTSRHHGNAAYSCELGYKLFSSHSQLTEEIYNDRSRFTCLRSRFLESLARSDRFLEWKGYDVVSPSTAQPWSRILYQQRQIRQQILIPSISSVTALHSANGGVLSKSKGRYAQVICQLPDPSGGGTLCLFLVKPSTRRKMKETRRRCMKVSMSSATLAESKVVASRGVSLGAYNGLRMLIRFVDAELSETLSVGAYKPPILMPTLSMAAGLHQIMYAGVLPVLGDLLLFRVLPVRRKCDDIDMKNQLMWGGLGPTILARTDAAKCQVEQVQRFETQALLYHADPRHRQCMMKTMELLKFVRQKILAEVGEGKEVMMARERHVTSLEYTS